VTPPVLPPVTADPDEAAEHLRTDGICRLTGVLASHEVEELREAVSNAIAADREAATTYDYSGGVNQRVWTLFNRGECFLRLAENPVVLSVIRTLLGPDALLSNLSANIAGPGGAPMVPHWDQDWADRPWPLALVAHAIWMIDAFTPDNGATLVGPGSHLLDGPPDPDRLMPATGPAGTALIVDGRVWHGTGTNVGNEGSRIAILAYYCRPYIRQQENMALSLDEGVRQSLTASRRKLFGLDFWEYLNMVGGPPRDLRRF
jgi:ectoine hydroxylase-related dioxygenase (phytanoyl-CoA dioxygenase family)